MTHPFYDGSRRRGVVAVVLRQGRFLVIRRAENVIAPGMICFPGGAGEGAETEPETLVREIREELGAAIEPLRPVWRSLTPWQVELAWWLSRIADDQRFQPNPEEVASVHWYTAEELRRLPNLLESNHHFLDALDAGEIDLQPE